MLVEILVPLTWPVDIKDPVYLEQVRYMQAYKAAMSEAPVLQSLLRFLVKALSKPVRERLDRDVDNIRLILSLFRNLIMIPDPQVAGNIPADLVRKARHQVRHCILSISNLSM